MSRPLSQEAPPAGANPSAAQVAGEIIVTGTRVSRAGYGAPTPTTVIGAVEIRATSPATIADFVNQLPALSNSTTPRTTGPVSSDGLGGVNFLNLRGLGPVRTLTLLDGRRVVASATIGAVDVNLLPTALISRVDVVTGGASAAWGSDAIAGVVNFVLDHKFEGLKGEFQNGISSHGDGGNRRFELSYGTKFANGKAHFIVSGSYSQVEPIDTATGRDWFKANKIIANPAFVAGDSQPRFVIAPNVGLSTATDGGLVVSGPLKGTQFLTGGAPAPFTYGSVSSLLMLGGTSNDVSNRTQLQAGLKQMTGYTGLSYDIANNVTLYAEGNYGRSIADTISVPYFRLGNIIIQRDNAFLDPVTRQRMIDADVTSFTMGRTNYDFGPALAHNVRTLYRAVAGAKGTFGGSWSWDAYYEYGRTNITNRIDVDPIVSRYNLATDAVFDPSSGSAVCRSSLTTPSNGCVPVNLFGAGSPSQAARNYILGQAVQHSRLQEQVAAASLRGEPFSTWAGQVSLAIGAEYRREQFDADADPVSQASDFWAGNFKPSSGGYNVKEGFAEVVVPLLRDIPLVRSFDLNGAIRVTDYSTSGAVTTWKVGGTWDVTHDIRLRGTTSRDIRAPNLNDLFLASSTQQQSVTDRANGNQSYLVRRVQTGNVNLQPEIARTYTAGIVLKPAWVSGFNLSVDYYDITIRNAITTLTAQQIVDRCFGGETSICSFISRGATGLITQVVATGINVQSEHTSGVDIDMSYRLPLSQISEAWAGNLTLKGLISYTHDRSITNGGVTDQQAGEYSDFAIPHWRGQLTASYSNGPLTAILRGRYIGSGAYVNAFTAQDIADNHVPAIAYIDLAASYRIPVAKGWVELFGAVDNLLDKDPPVSPATMGNTFAFYGVNPALYDTVGRMMRVGARFSF